MHPHYSTIQPSISHLYISTPESSIYPKPPMADSDHHTIRTTTNDSCKYKGVRKRKWGKWVSEIRLPNSRERIWLGSYDSPEKAARAFDAALYCLRGRRASFNFPDTPLELELSSTVSGDHHQSRSAQEIQELAARFANKHQQEPPMVQQQSSEAAAPSSCESDGVTEIGDHVEVDNNGVVGDIRSVNNNDWSFLKSLDEIGSANYDGFYSGLDKMHSGELLFPTSPPHLLIDHVSDNGDAMECDDAFSQQSLFLWNF